MAIRKDRVIPPEEKRKEGQYIKARWLAYKDANPGETQDSFAAKLGVTQGTLQQVFRGDIAAPIEMLLDLAILLEFDPREVRPYVDVIAGKLNQAIAGKNACNLDARISALPQDLKAAAVEYLDYLASKPRFDA